MRGASRGAYGLVVAPLDIFNDTWSRCGHIEGLYAFLAPRLTGALQPDELLRAEWVARVSALDLFVHELVAQNMLAVFDGSRTETDSFKKFMVPWETRNRIRNAGSAQDASAAFDLEVRSRLSVITYQDPEKIADGIRLISGIELWNEIALSQGANQANKAAKAKALKATLSAIVGRRNKIAHEGDLQPALPRTPWPVSRTDVDDVKNYIQSLVTTIDALV